MVNFALILAVSIVVVGLAFMLISIARAPEGFEDREGFHFGQPPVDPSDPYTDQPLMRRPVSRRRKAESRRKS